MYVCMYVCIHACIYYILCNTRRRRGARPRYELISNSSPLPLVVLPEQSAAELALGEKSHFLRPKGSPKSHRLARPCASSPPASPANICLRKFRKVYTRAPEPAAFQAGVFLQVNFLSEPRTPRPAPRVPLLMREPPFLIISAREKIAWRLRKRA